MWKMYSIWLEDREVHLHRFLWRDSGKDEIEEYAITREERRVLQEDAYADDILTSHNSMDQLKWEERVQRQEYRVFLPNQLTEDDNKALGLGYTLQDDKFHIMIAVNFSKKSRKMRLGQDLLKGQVRSQAPNPLTRRELLSQVSELYDPLGLVTPAKQKGAILVQGAFQEAKVNYGPTKDTWYAALSEGLLEDAIKLLEEYVELG
ncbi:uncharacterized protein LOC122145514 [Tachysurus ichikawai]